jgi:capsular exopolysaccharide synthesis family protein
MSRVSEAISRARAAAGQGTEDGSPTWIRPVRDDSQDPVPWTMVDAEARPIKRVLRRVEAVSTAALPAGSTAVRPMAAPAVLVLQDVRLESAKGTPVIATRFQERVVCGGAPPAIAEQFRQLAATLHQAHLERGVRVVMVTSATPSEGKSLTSTNLALTLSGSYKRRVLLVDADLRCPSLHEIFEVASASGLSDGLRRPDFAPFRTVGISGTLALLPAGRPDPDPMASLTSTRMRLVIDEARRKFDWVIVDTPPVASMPDANLLAGMVDTVLLVVGARIASYDVIRQAVKSIGKKKIVGVVLNRAEAPMSVGYGS